MMKNIEKWWTSLDVKWRNIFYHSLDMVEQNSTYFNNPIIESLEHKVKTIKNIREFEDFYALYHLIPYISHLYLNDKKLDDISPLVAFKNLEALDLKNNNIEDITTLKYLPNLKILWLDENPITNYSVLNQLPKLEFVSKN
jgi:Leucine-rich repeat (LRR) protein